MAILFLILVYIKYVREQRDRRLDEEFFKLVRECRPYVEYYSTRENAALFLAVY